MKKIKFLYGYILAGVLLMVSSCKEEDKFPIPDFETAVHAFGSYQSGSPQAFTYGDPSKILNMQIQWVSIDNANTVEKIELFITFTESYVDKDGNPRVANHGIKADPALILTGMGNRENKPFSISQAKVYDLFKNATFNYGDGTVPVFANPKKPERNATDRFVAGDSFSVTWRLTAADGRVFDSWSDSVCGEFAGANCSLSWSVICVSNLAGVLNFSTTSMVAGNGTGGGSPVPGTATGTVTWGQVMADGKPVAGKYTSTDVTFGHFEFVYGPPADNKPIIGDACGAIAVIGSGIYSDTYTYTISGISGATMVISWRNPYGDSGVSTVTRADGKSWPTNLRGAL